MIKYWGLFIMVLDHFLLFFCPQWPYIDLVHIIGVFFGTPVFCFMAVQGFLFTRDVNRYLLNLVVFALISQVVFSYVHPDNLTPNFMFTLFWGVLILHLMKSGFKFSWLLAVPLIHFHMVYFHIVFIFLFYMLRDSDLFSFFFRLPRWNNRFIPKYFFYAFYPAHYLLFSFFS